MPIDDDAVLWNVPDGERAGRPLLVLLHGYGSHEGDLFGLAPDLPEELVIAAVRAPDRHPLGTGWQWYPIPLEGGVQAGNDATDDFAAWLHGARAGATSTGLLGFSQGGSIAIQTLRRHPDLVDYVVVLAGLMAPEPEEGDEVLAERRPPVFWGRGSADLMIEPARVATLSEWLPSHTTLTRRVYPGLGHGVSEDELADVTAFLRERL